MKTLLLSLFALFSSAAFGATVTVTAAPGSANGKATPAITWSSSPSGGTCVASGGWSGAKSASGTQTMPEITKSTTYTLTCNWPAVAGPGGKATVAWTPPITNTDGSALTDLAAFRVVSGTAPTALTQSTTVIAPATTVDITGLAEGTWYFAVIAVNASGVESSLSNVASRAVPFTGTPAQSASGFALVTISTVPNPPVLTTISVAARAPSSSPLFRVLGPDKKHYPGEMFGIIETGRACGEKVFTYRAKTFYRVVATLDDVWSTKDLTNLAAPCA